MHAQTEDVPPIQTVPPPQPRSTTHYRHENTGRYIPSTSTPPLHLLFTMATQNQCRKTIQENSTQANLELSPARKKSTQNPQTRQKYCPQQSTNTPNFRSKQSKMAIGHHEDGPPAIGLVSRHPWRSSSWCKPSGCDCTLGSHLRPW